MSDVLHRTINLRQPRLAVGFFSALRFDRKNRRDFDLPPCHHIGRKKIVAEIAKSMAHINKINILINNIKIISQLY
jgi:hypothetical protein